MPRFSVRSLRWLIAGILLAATVAWFRLRPVPVHAHRVASCTVIGETMGTGTLEARASATISPKITGRLHSILVDQGDTVTAGQELARLDDAEARRQLEVAQAALAAAAATVQRVRTESDRAAAVLDQARLEHGRAITLAAARTVSEAERDKAQEQLHVAEAEDARARAMIIEAGAMERAAASQVALQEELLAHTRLLAPFDGLVVRRHRDPGDVVSPGGAVLLVVSLDEVWISAWVDETAISRLAPDQPAQIIFRSEPHRQYAGHVARLGRETDRETREFLVDVRLENLPANWTIGQRAEVFIETGRREDTLGIPPGFLAHRDGHPGVLVERDGRVQFETVTIGLQGSQSVEILEGIKAGDLVVTAVPGGRSPEGRRIALP